MRPATAPVGSRITASESDSHTSWPARGIETRRFTPPLSDSSSRCSTCTGVRQNASAEGTPVISSAAEFKSTTRTSRVDRHHALGDVRQDRHALLALQRDAVVGSAFDSATDAFAASATSASPPRRAHRRGRPSETQPRRPRTGPSSRPEQRHAEEGAGAGRQEHVRTRRASDRRRRPRAARARAPARRRRRRKPVADMRSPSASSAPSPTTAPITSSPSSSVISAAASRRAARRPPRRPS
jgi:hypothetical protein